MFDTPESYIGKPLRELPDEIARQAWRDGERPTIKAMIALNKRCQRNHPLATYRAVPQREDSDRLLNFPGGGLQRRSQEGWIRALYRELQEELCDLRVTDAQLRAAPILAMQSIQSDRTKYQAKLLVVVGLLLPRKQFTVSRLEPTGDELTELVIGTICSAVFRLSQMQQTKPETAAVYRSAFSNLREHLTP